METSFEDTIAAVMTSDLIPIDVGRQVVAASKILIERARYRQFKGHGQKTPNELKWAILC